MSGSRAVAARASMAVVSLVAGACLVTPAEASTVQVQDGTLTITQAPGESTSFVLRAPFHEPSATGPQPPPGTWLVQRDATPGRAGTPPTAGPGCVGTPNPHPEISCSSVARVDIAFGGGADSAFVSAFQDPKVPVRISGGDGDDDLNVAIPPGDVTVDGGPGNDTITTGNARVAGGPGDDAITLGWNPDDYTGPVIDCGPGNDHFENDSTLPASVRIADAVTAEQLAGHRRRDGQEGAWRATWPPRSWSSAYAAGKPAAAPDPDTLDAHELAVRRGSAASAEDVQALFEACPASLLCAIAAVAAPQVQEHLQTAVRAGRAPAGRVRRRGTRSMRAGVARTRTPAARPTGRPRSVKRGHAPTEVAELFEACPAWMPDVHRGRPRCPTPTPTRSAPCADPARRAGRLGRRPRQPAPITVSKRAKRPAASATGGRTGVAQAAGERARPRGGGSAIMTAPPQDRVSVPLRRSRQCAAREVNFTPIPE